MKNSTEQRTFAQAVLRSAVRNLPATAIARLAGQQLVAPCYHLVSDDSPVHTRHLYSHRNVAAFRQDLDDLLKHFKPIALDDLAGLIAADLDIPNGSLFLSFDDGFREMREIVAPICLEKGVPATFFLTTNFLDNQELGFRHKASLLIEVCRQRGISLDAASLAPLRSFCGLMKSDGRDLRRLFLSVNYPNRRVLDECAVLLGVDFDAYLKTERPYLTRNDAAALLADGFSLGGHSVDHPLYADIPLRQQLAQTRQCMEDLGTRFAIGAKAFAFPFVSDGVNERFFSEIFNRNTVDLAFCIGHMPKEGGARAIQRFGVESEEQWSISDLLRRSVRGRLGQRISKWKARKVSK